MQLCVKEDKFDASSVLDIQWAGGKIQKENISEVVFVHGQYQIKIDKVLPGEFTGAAGKLYIMFMGNLP